MNFNKAFIFGSILTTCLTINCSTSTNYAQEGLDATVTLSNWIQIPIGTSFGDVQINYKIENTGSVDISKYEVYFKADAVNDTVYEGDGSGEDLKVGEIDFNSARFSTNLNKAITVEITGKFLLYDSGYL